MVRHLAPGMTHPIEAAANLAQRFEPCAPISVIKVNIFAPVATRRNVVQATSQFDPQRSSHNQRPDLKMLDCKT